MFYGWAMRSAMESSNYNTNSLGGAQEWSDLLGADADAICNGEAKRTPWEAHKSMATSSDLLGATALASADLHAIVGNMHVARDAWMCGCIMLTWM